MNNFVPVVQFYVNLGWLGLDDVPQVCSVPLQADWHMNRLSFADSPQGNHERLRHKFSKRRDRNHEDVVFVTDPSSSLNRNASYDWKIVDRTGIEDVVIGINCDTNARKFQRINQSSPT